MPFFRSKEKKKLPGAKQPAAHGSPKRLAPRALAEDDRKRHSASLSDFNVEAHQHPTPSPSVQDFGRAAGAVSPTPLGFSAERSRAHTHAVARVGSVDKTRAFFEGKSYSVDQQSSNKAGQTLTNDSPPIVAIRGARDAPPPSTDANSGSAVSLTSGPSSQSSLQPALGSIMDYLDLEPALPEFEGLSLSLPPLQTTSVKHRDVLASKNAPGGGFGFILRKSYLPVPEDPDMTRLVHLVEPRADYDGPLMTGDRIIEVNGVNVEEEPHEGVVDMIKASGDSVELLVASMPELVELNARGAFDDSGGGGGVARGGATRRSGRAKQWTGTLRKKSTDTRKAFKVREGGREVLTRYGVLQLLSCCRHADSVCQA